jgi:hypothetical protein
MFLGPVAMVLSLTRKVELKTGQSGDHSKTDWISAQATNQEHIKGIKSLFEIHNKKINE